MGVSAVVPPPHLPAGTASHHIKQVDGHNPQDVNALVHHYRAGTHAAVHPGTHVAAAPVPPASHHLPPGTQSGHGSHPVNTEQGLVLHPTESAAAKDVRPSMVTFVDQRQC